MNKKIRFSEKFALADLDANAISDLTFKYLFDREHGDGKNVIRLFGIRIFYNRLYIQYRSYPTYTKSNIRILPNGSEIKTNYYDTLFEVEDVLGHLGDKETFMSFTVGQRLALLRDFLENGQTRVFCNCGAFYYQGMWEDMAQTDSVVFPFPGPEGRGIWRARHAKGLKIPEVRICKHIAAAIHYIFNKNLRTIERKLRTLPDYETNL